MPLPQELSRPFDELVSFYEAVAPRAAEAIAQFWAHATFFEHARLEPVKGCCGRE